MKNNPELLRALQYFTREKEIMSGLLLVCEADGRTEAALDGEVKENSVFDLASLTKLFTGLCALRLKEDGLLDIGRPVFSYDPRFTELKDVTVEQLMSFTGTGRKLSDACSVRYQPARRKAAPILISPPWC